LDSSTAAVPPPKKTFAHQNPVLAANANKEAAKKLKMQMLGKLGKTPPVESNPSGGFSMLDFQDSAPATIDRIVVQEEEKIAPSPAEKVSEEEDEEIVVEEAAAPSTDSVAFNEDDCGADEDEEEVEEGDVPQTHAKAEDVDSDEEAPQDDIRLWEDGWKTRYYEKKFEVDVGNEKFRKRYLEFCPL
jgi:5'-3' exonuclease